MNRARPLTVLLPALLLAGCCCDRTPRRDPYTIVCPSPAPQQTPVPAPAPTATPESTSPCVRPPRLAPAAPGGAPAPAPAIPDPPGPTKLMIVDVADLTAATPIDTLVARLRAVSPPGTDVSAKGASAIVVRGTPEAHAKVGAWLAELRMDAAAPK